MSGKAFLWCSWKNWLAEWFFFFSTFTNVYFSFWIIPMSIYLVSEYTQCCRCSSVGWRGQSLNFQQEDRRLLYHTHTHCLCRWLFLCSDDSTNEQGEWNAIAAHERLVDRCVERRWHEDMELWIVTVQRWRRLGMMLINCADELCTLCWWSYVCVEYQNSICCRVVRMVMFKGVGHR